MFNKLLLLLFVSFGSYAGDVRLNVGVGTENVNMSSDLDDRVDHAGELSLATSIHVGYVLPNNFIVDLGYGFLTNDVFWDQNNNIHLNTYEISVGYLFENGLFYLEPKLGFAKWELDLEEGEFLNSGSEYKFGETGSDPYLMLTAGLRFAGNFGMSLSYKYFDFDYGTADSYILGLDWRF